jgi:hypothetical protein
MKWSSKTGQEFVDNSYYIGAKALTLYQKDGQPLGSQTGQSERRSFSLCLLPSILYQQLKNQPDTFFVSTR